MRIFAVRHIEDKQAVGIVFSEDLDDVVEWVERATDAVLCEYKEIVEYGALLWESTAPGLGVDRDFADDLSVGDIEIEQLKRGLSIHGSLEEFFYEEIPNTRWKFLVPGDHPRTAAEMSRLHERRLEEYIRATEKLPSPPQSGKKSPATREPLIITTNVYFIGCGDHVKIGIANSVEKRLKSLATGHHQELTLLAVIKDAPGEMEIELHQRFAEHRVRGEWFKLSPEIQAFIDEVKARG